jgi:hypothetical protein
MLDTAGKAKSAKSSKTKRGQALAPQESNPNHWAYSVTLQFDKAAKAAVRRARAAGILPAGLAFDTSVKPAKKARRAKD